jgi:hypothetical protein
VSPHDVSQAVNPQVSPPQELEQSPLGNWGPVVPIDPSST